MHDLAFCLLGGDIGVPNPTDCAAVPAEICAGESVQLSANSAYDIYWYTGSCGGTLVGTGSPLTVSPTVTTTYYARA
ncbi:hypothetical protein V6O07_09315, partial [Arthrospira platensis SPKY2]